MDIDHNIVTDYIEPDGAPLFDPCNSQKYKRIKTSLKSVPPLMEKNSFYEKLLVFNYSSLVFSTRAKFLTIVVLFAAIIIIV